MKTESPDRRALVHASLVLPSPLERYRPRPSRRAVHGVVTLVSDGETGPDFNRALVLGPAHPDTVFAWAEAFFGDPSGYSILLQVEVAHEMEAALRLRGWRLDEEEPSLVLVPLPAVVPPAPAGLVIRRVGDAAGYADFQTVSETPSVFLPSLEAAMDPLVGLFVGYVDGQPVATARLTCLGSIVDLNGVATIPAARRRGYGTALTWAAVAAGRDRGCTAAILTATTMGYPVYLGMGFRPAGVYRTFVPPERESNVAMRSR